MQQAEVKRALKLRLKCTANRQITIEKFAVLITGCEMNLVKLLKEKFNKLSDTLF